MRICFQSTDINGEKSPVQFVDPGNRTLLQLPEHKVNIWLDELGGPPNPTHLVPMVGEEEKRSEAIALPSVGIEFNNGLNDPRIDLFWQAAKEPAAPDAPKDDEQDLSHLDKPKTDDQ